MLYDNGWRQPAYRVRREEDEVVSENPGPDEGNILISLSVLYTVDSYVHGDGEATYDQNPNLRQARSP